jgi:hypothetical protein
MMDMKCPWCGGEIRIIVCDYEGNPKGALYEQNPYSGLSYRLYHDINDCPADVECPIAGHEYEGFLGVWTYDTREEAIEAWNKRMYK